MTHDDPDPQRPAVDPTAEGVRARSGGISRDLCPYALDSEERHEWLEGYDGMPLSASPMVAERCH